jgi:hypothetical protein
VQAIRVRYLGYCAARRPGDSASSRVLPRAEDLLRAFGKNWEFRDLNVPEPPRGAVL